jgi:hypothetical protein
VSTILKNGIKKEKKKKKESWAIWFSILGLTFCQLCCKRIAQGKKFIGQLIIIDVGVIFSRS